MPDFNKYPLTTNHARICQGPVLFHMTELLGAPPVLKKYPPRTGRLITYVQVQQSSPGFILHATNETRSNQDS